MSAMVDRISALPDSLICHILSFLQTEEAISTCLLSKRWRPLWLGVSSLHFDDSKYSQNKDAYSRFIQLVYAVMLSRGDEKPIEDFRLTSQSSSSMFDSSAVNIWVRAATRCKVQRLSLSLRSTVTLMSSVFSSATLVVLKLSGFRVKNNHSSLSFPSLKVLDLRMIRFLHPQDIVEILSVCPILEVFIMRYLIFDYVPLGWSTPHIKLPKLVKADISNSRASLPLEPFYDVQFLRANVFTTEKLPTHKLVNLTNMELTFLNNYTCWLINLLHFCPNLQTLVVDKIETKLLVYKNWVSPKSVPKCFSSQLKRFCCKNYKGMENEFQLIKYLMQEARVLRDVTIWCVGSLNSEDKLQLLKNLSVCGRASVLCLLHFQ